MLYLPIPLGLPVMLCPPFFDLQIQLAICYGYNMLQSPQTQLDCWIASAPLDPSDQGCFQSWTRFKQQPVQPCPSHCVLIPVFSSMKLWYLCIYSIAMQFLFAYLKMMKASTNPRSQRCWSVLFVAGVRRRLQQVQTVPWIHGAGRLMLT